VEQALGKSCRETGSGTEEESRVRSRMVGIQRSKSKTEDYGEW
jgi:hypothetical protein